MMAALALACLAAVARAGQVSLSKLSLHVGDVTGVDATVIQWLAVTRPRVLKLLNPRTGWAAAALAASPQTVLIGRIWTPTQPATGDPTAAATAWDAASAPYFAASPEIRLWEGYNELPGTTAHAGMQWFATFETARVRLLAARGLRAVVGNFESGAPLDLDPATSSFSLFVPAVRAAAAAGGMLGLHEYSSPLLYSCFDNATMTGVLTGRYRALYASFFPSSSDAAPPPALLVSEAGIGYAPPACGGTATAVGWRAYCANWTAPGGPFPGMACTDALVSQLAWYDAMLRADAYVAGATLFCQNCGTFPSFNTSAALDALAAYMNSSPAAVAAAAAVADAEDSAGDEAAAPLDWEVRDLGPLLGAPTYYHASNGDKDGSIVAARLAGATGGVSDTRALYYPTNFSRYADGAYLADVAARTVQRYAEAAARPPAPRAAPLLLSNGTLVVSSVHRLALAAAEALHARLLPAQALGFAAEWAQACAASGGGGGAGAGAVVLVGCDFGADLLWLWIKPAAAGGVPPAHTAAMAAADALVLLRATDGDEYLGTLDCGGGNSAGGAPGPPLYLHASLASCAADDAQFPRVAALLAAARPRIAPLPNASALRGWEWGLPDATVAAYRAAWASLGKRATALTLLEGGVVAGYLACPALWAAYLAANGQAARGLAVYGYWTAQPSLDRLGAALPLPVYAFSKPDWHPLRDAANASLAALVAAVGGGARGAAAVGAHTRFYVNTVGSATDAAGAQQLLEGFGPAMAARAWLSVGLDCPPAACTSANGSVALPAPHEHAAALLSNASGTLLPPQAWVPLTPAEVAEAVAPWWPSQAL